MTPGSKLKTRRLRLAKNLPMAFTKAIVVVGDNKASVQRVSLPQLRDGWVLVEVKAIALNPTDWKHVAWGGTDIGCRVGCDYAGIVEEVGAKVSTFVQGDRITGWIHGSSVCSSRDPVDAEQSHVGTEPIQAPAHLLNMPSQKLVFRERFQTT